MTTKLGRREFLKGSLLAGGAVAGASLSCKGRPTARANPTGPKVALIHATDLFRPHADPDDHFDLATAFALAGQGRLDLLAVMIDHPTAGIAADPDVLAVAQMNRITGLAVPALAGSKGAQDDSGAKALLGIMRRSSLPVAITVVGSCRDVALAGRLEPDLFAKKCAGVYLNAGSGTPDRALAARLEYNVSLDPASYAAMFSLPCPLYWLPCFEIAPGGGHGFAGGEFGTYYKFLQKDLWPLISPRLRNFFAFMLKQGESDRSDQTAEDALRPDWLRYLEGPNEEAVLVRQGERFRNMWSTAGFLHAAGLTVSTDGSVGPVAGTASPVYSFDPVRVACGPDGVTAWSPDDRSRDRFIFHVRDVAAYPAAMTKALSGLLAVLA